jgi:hypothetical protein
MNTAVVLREEHVIKKQTEEIVKKFDYLENGERNEDEFLSWQQEMKMNDLRQQVEESEKLKLQSKISYENAKLAREEAALTNKTIAKELLIQKDILNKKRNEQKKEDELLKKKIVNEVKENEKYVINTVKDEVLNTKKAIAQEVAKESEILQLKAFKEV